MIIHDLFVFQFTSPGSTALQLGPLRIAQIVSLVGIALGLFGLYLLYWRQQSLPDVVVHQEVSQEVEH